MAGQQGQTLQTQLKELDGARHPCHLLQFNATQVELDTKKVEEIAKGWDVPRKSSGSPRSNDCKHSTHLQDPGSERTQNQEAGTHRLGSKKHMSRRNAGLQIGSIPSHSA